MNMKYLEVFILFCQKTNLTIYCKIRIIKKEQKCKHSLLLNLIRDGKLITCRNVSDICCSVSDIINNLKHWCLGDREIYYPRKQYFLRTVLGGNKSPYLIHNHAINIH